MKRLFQKTNCGFKLEEMFVPKRKGGTRGAEAITANQLGHSLFAHFAQFSSL